MSRFAIGIIAPNFNGNDGFTKILLHMDGSNGGTSFPDSNIGGSTHSWTASAATTSTAASKFGSASGLFATGYVSAPQSADLEPGSGDYTIDFWLAIASAGAAKAIFGYSGVGSTAGPFYAVRNAANKIAVAASTSGTSPTLTSATSISDGVFHHIAIVRSGSTLSLFIDGTLDASAAISGTSNTSTGTFRVGQTGDYALVNALIGNVDEFRYSVGVARWTANFTPPTSAYS